MKNLYTLSAIIAVILFATACGTKQKEQVATAPGVTILADTNGLAQFQIWKAAQLNNANAEEKATAKKTYKPARKKTNTVRYASTQPVQQSSIYKSGSEVITPSTPVSLPQEEKKGWSKAAKGAAIGAGTGAVLGAVIGKNNRVAGGVIGGVVGGAVGYGIGRSMDKKDGRY